MTAYTLNSPQYQAIQWTGANLADVTTFLPEGVGGLNLATDGSNSLWLIVGDGYIEVPETSWVVLTGVFGGVLESANQWYNAIVVDDGDFASSFTAV